MDIELRLLGKIIVSQINQHSQNNQSDHYFRQTALKNLDNNKQEDENGDSDNDPGC
jgi:hypothetical protein